MIRAIESVRLQWLLDELSSQLGFDMAARESQKFGVIVPFGVDAFTDLVFVVEGLDPLASKQLRLQVRHLVAKHFELWTISDDA